MIRWCAYCQRYLGETPPWGDMQITHGICPACSTMMKSKGEKEFSEHAIALADLFRRIKESAVSGQPGGAEQLMGEARRIGIYPLDLAFGMIQPVLNEIGILWAEGKATISVEHRFSMIAEELIALVSAEYRELAEFRQSERPTALLSIAEGNYHTLGLRFLEIALLERRVPTYTVLPGLPAADLFALVERLAPRALGISVSLPTQLTSVREIARLIGTLPKTVRPRIVIGGHLIREGLELRPEFGVDTASDLSSFLEMIDMARSD